MTLEQVRVKRGKQHRFELRRTDRLCTFEATMEDVLDYGTRLGNDDVLKNIAEDSNCEQCGCDCSDSTTEFSGVACQGVYPICAGQSETVDAIWNNDGRHACHRRVVCISCFRAAVNDREASERASAAKRSKSKSTPTSATLRTWEVLSTSRRANRTSGTLGTDDYCYYCTACMSLQRDGTDDPADVWGADIIDAGRHLRLGTVHATTVPKARPFTQQPAAAEDARAERREQRWRAGVLKYASMGGSLAIQAACAFYRFVRQVFMPVSQAQHMLRVFNDIEGMRAKYYAEHSARSSADLPDVHPPALPRTMKVLEERASFGSVTDADVRFEQVTYSMHNVQQNQKEVNVLFADLEETLQRLLLDPRLPAYERVLRPASVKAEYTLANGERVFGPEAWQATLWDDLNATLPQRDDVLLFLIVSSDAVATAHGSRVPMRLTLANLSMRVRGSDAGNPLIGLGPVINLFFKRGMKTAISLNAPQRSAQHQIHATAVAQGLVQLEELAKHALTFKLRMDDGATGEVRNVRVRVGIFASDYAETKQVLGMNGGNYATNACPRCMFLKPASENGPRPYMNPDFRCHLSEKRTVQSVVSEQARLVHLARTGGTRSEVASRASKSGIDHSVQCMLSRLSTVFPHEVDGPFSAFFPDALHSLLLGLAPKMIKLVDAVLMLSFNKKIFDVLKSKDDAKVRMDTRLSRYPSFPGLERFNSGFWEGRGTSTPSGQTNRALVMYLMFVYLEDKALVSDCALRTRLLTLHYSVSRFIEELHTPQGYTDQELCDLDAEVVLMLTEFDFFMTELEDAGALEGELMNCFKTHDFASVAADMRRIGCMLNADTSAFERRMKSVRKHDRLIAVSRSNDGSEKLLTRGMANEMNSQAEARMRAELAASSTYPMHDSDDDDDDIGDNDDGAQDFAQAPKKGSFPVAQGSTFMRRLLNEVRDGANGPAVRPDFLDHAADAVFAAIGPGAHFFLQRKFTSRDPGVTTTKQSVLRVGHVVQLNNLNEWGQIVMPFLARADRSDAGCLMLAFEFVDVHRTNHPAVPMAHLRRRGGPQAMIVLQASSILRRAHLIPIFEGTATGEPCEAFPERFIVNPLVHPTFRAVNPDRAVYLSCPRGCEGGRLRRPPRAGQDATCDQCGVASPWN